MMLELLEHYSLDEIITFIVLLSLALRGGWDFIKWGKERYNEKFNKDYTAKTKEKTLQEYYDNCIKQFEQEKELYNKLEQKIDSLSEVCTIRFAHIEERLELLTKSDRDDIKSWLVEKYNYYKANPGIPISSHTIDTIEKRYNHYKREGGNSYIDEIIIPWLRNRAKENSNV